MSRNLLIFEFALGGLVYREAETPDLFAIISWGAAGTHWVSKLLNSHAEVFCAHGLKIHWVYVTDASPVDDIKYLQIIARTAAGYKLAGECHGINRESIEHISAKWPNHFRAAVVVRHPIPRVVSAWNHAQLVGRDAYKLDYVYLYNLLTLDQRNWLKTEEELFFVHLMSLVNVVTVEQTVGPIYPIEKLSAHPAESQKLLDYLSNNRLRFEPGLLDAIFNKPVVSHTGSNAPKDPCSVYQSIPEWQQRAFRSLLSEEAKSTYEELSYDFRFL